MDGNVLQIFPELIGQLKFRDYSEQEEQVLNQALENLNLNGGGGNNGTTANRYLLDSPGLENMKAELTSIVNSYYQNVYKPTHPVELYITNSWANFNAPGQSHHLHSHNNSVLSGVLYLNADPTDTITFVRGFEFMPTILPHYHPDNMYKMSQDISVDQNMLILFQSTLGHSVKPLNRDGVRVSLSFNTFYRGTIGSEETLDRIELK